MTIEKVITTRKELGRDSWCMETADRLGITISCVPLSAREVEKIIEGFNAASRAGAPWGIYVKQARR